MLNDYGNVGLDDTGIIGVARYRFRIGQIVEAKVQSAAGRHRHPVRPDRLPIGKVERDLNVCIGAAGVQQAVSWLSIDLLSPVLLPGM